VRPRGSWQLGASPLALEACNLEPGVALPAALAPFLHSVRTGDACVVSGRDGQAALELAERILADIGSRRASDP
jgi:hypothetical protein